MRLFNFHRLPSWLACIVGCALGLQLGWVPTSRLDPFRELRPSPGRLVGLAYRARIGEPPRKRVLEVSKDNERLILEEGSLEKRDKLRSRAVYSLAENRPDPAIEYLEEAVETTQGIEQALLRNDLAAALLARSWPDWKDRPGFFSRGDDLFRAVDLAAQALEIIPDLKEAQFNLALGLETLTLRETAKEEWQRYLTLDPGSPWADEARAHLRLLAIPIPIRPQPNAMNPEGKLDEKDPAVRIYRAGRKALREQRYSEARVTFRKAREMWRSSNPRMAGWATYRIGVCDYVERVRKGLEDLTPLTRLGDPALAARATYLRGIDLLDRSSFFNTNQLLGEGLHKSYETEEIDLSSRLESALAVSLGGNRHRSFLHHLSALCDSVVALSPRTRLVALENASKSAEALELWRIASILERERLTWINRHNADLHPLSRLRALFHLSHLTYRSGRLDLARLALRQGVQEIEGISELRYRLSLLHSATYLESRIFSSEQRALFSQSAVSRVSPLVLANLDASRYVPELFPYYRELEGYQGENQWPLIEALHREIDRIEGGVVDVVSERSRLFSIFHPADSLYSSSRSAIQLMSFTSELFGPGKILRGAGLWEEDALIALEGVRATNLLIIGRSGMDSQTIHMKKLQASEYTREWREGLERPETLHFRRASEGLMRDLGVPLVQRLARVKLVGIILGHGILDPLPLAAIRDPHTGRFLVELYEIFVVPECSVVSSEQKGSAANRPKIAPLAKATRTKALGAFPAPRAMSSTQERVLLVLGSAGPSDSKPLLGGEREIEALARRFPNHRILRGAEATKENVLAELLWATIAHFATHGLIDGDDPDDTGLLLVPGGTTDSRLTVGDVKKLSLPNLRLVVLSTCNSGRSTGSPESLSVASAFIARGVPAAVASLMPIDDRTAPLFFKPFYDHLDRTGDPIRALRQTQIDFARGPDPDSALRIWAPYVVMISPGLPLPE